MPDDAALPVRLIPTDDATAAPEPGMALGLSGGGYRAMVFHVGVIWRLYEAGLLKGLKRISSVSGGSITAGMLGLKWNRLSFDPAKMAADFVPEFVAPIREMAGMTIDAESIILGLLLPGKIADRVADAYDDQLYRGAMLKDLPDPATAPLFVFNATSVQSGALWRFTRPYMRDWRVGEIKNPDVKLAVAVAASSAFPPVLSPYALKLDPASFTPNSGDGLQKPPFTSKAVLTDGGVYDNLGLETIWKRYDTILVSDAGGQLAAEEEPKADWAQHSYRIFNLVDNQVRSLRKRQLIDSYISKARKGTYWGIRSDIAHFQLPDALPCPATNTLALAETPTRLKRLEERLQERLINWGYAVCDAALRKHLNPDLPVPVGKPAGFPYPAAGV